jgi:hypothetical protein
MYSSSAGALDDFKLSALLAVFLFDDGLYQPPDVIRFLQTGDQGHYL